jgi:hypothetical protein
MRLPGEESDLHDHNSKRLSGGKGEGGSGGKNEGVASVPRGGLAEHKQQQQHKQAAHAGGARGGGDRDEQGRDYGRECRRESSLSYSENVGDQPVALSNPPRPRYWYSVYLLYWYKSANTDAAAGSSV